jgi:excisionase family DNA binding protein
MVKVAEKEYYTVGEAAEVLDVSRATIWRWIDAGRLPAYRLGPKSIRIRRADLEMVITPARESGAVIPEQNKPDEGWGDYDPDKVKDAIASTAGTWADVDSDDLVADLYRAREEGSRPEGRP